MRRLTPLENQVADLIIDLRKSERMRVPSPNKIQRIVEILEEEYGLEKLRTIKKHNQAEIVYFTGIQKSALIFS